jgi:predicted enzyme related to lactoylglutathione lyase
MITHAVRTVLLCLVPLSIICTPEVSDAHAQPDPSTDEVRESDQGFNEEEAVIVHYLEIVTPEVDATYEALDNLLGVSFSEPIPELGHARTAPLDSGGRIGVRAPMRETEEPVVRPYLLVENIEAAVDAAQAAGGEIAMPPTEIPGQGKFAIYILGGIQHGLWQI